MKVALALHRLGLRGSLMHSLGIGSIFAAISLWGRSAAVSDKDRRAVRETFVRNRADTPKSEAGERTIALGPVLADELFQHRSRTSFRGDDERVFCHPLTGEPLDHKRYAATLKAALARAEVPGPMRPFHDGRHSAITNGAATGINPFALMKQAGHTDFKTTQIYIDLAGQTFREEAELAEQRLLGAIRYKKPVQTGAAVVESENEEGEETAC
jgi:integrase